VASGKARGGTGAAGVSGIFGGNEGLGAGLGAICDGEVDGTAANNGGGAGVSETENTANSGAPFMT
jgi:hypothetical protein